MSHQRGTTPTIKIQRGTTEIIRVQRGSTVTYEPGGGRGDDFNRPDGAMGSAWTDLGPSTDNKLAVLNHFARVAIPDGLIGAFWDYRASFMRYNVAVNPGDDGFVECRPATLGDGGNILTPGYISQVFGRGNNTGSTCTDGVGYELLSGSVYICRRLASNDTLMTPGVTFQAGDIIRHTFVGNLHKIYVNGVNDPDRGVWNDSGATAHKAAGYRSLIIRGDGGKDFLGPRRFSAAFDYVKMG